MPHRDGAIATSVEHAVLVALDGDLAKEGRGPDAAPDEAAREAGRDLEQESRERSRSAGGASRAPYGDVVRAAHKRAGRDNPAVAGGGSHRRAASAEARGVSIQLH